jgi:signal transduction histidine kinase
MAGRHDNEPVDTQERPGWRQQVRDLLRPEPEGAPLSRKTVTADAAFAIVLTFFALVAAAAAKVPGGDHPILIGPHVPVPPEPSMLPVPPEPPMLPIPPELPVPPLAPPPAFDVHDIPWPLTVLTALPLAVRRRYPLTVFCVLMCAALWVRLNLTWITVLACVIGAYGAITYSRYRVQAMAGLVLAAALAGAAFRHGLPSLPGWSGPFFVLLIAGVLASFVRSWRQRLGASQRRFIELQQTQEEAMRRAVESERGRIAAELHDVVTHNVSVMVIQTGAARKVMDTAPELSKQAMLATEASGRAALSELRHVMGLLSASDNEKSDGLEPQPGLEQLSTLVEGVRAAGIAVSLTVSPPPGPLPPGVDLTAYRVVQEGLTNTIKHAVGAVATVTIGHHGDWLEIEVADTGGVPEAGAPEAGNGRGLIGLRERLAVYGGTLEAGRLIGGGYQVKARVPWRTA